MNTALQTWVYLISFQSTLKSRRNEAWGSRGVGFLLPLTIYYACLLFLSLHLTSKRLLHNLCSCFFFDGMRLLLSWGILIKHDISQEIQTCNERLWQNLCPGFPNCDADYLTLLNNYLVQEVLQFQLSVPFGFNSIHFKASVLSSASLQAALGLDLSLRLGL